MMTKEELRDALLDTVDRNHALIEQITPEGAEAKTPCRDMNVRQLVAHLVDSCRTLIDGIGGGAPEHRGDADVVGDDLVAAHERTRRSIREVLTDPDVLERRWSMFSSEVEPDEGLGIFLMEVTQHGWDLATALDVDRRYDPAIAEELLERARTQIGDDRGDGSVFGPPQPVDEQVDPSDKLAAYLGREI